MTTITIIIIIIQSGLGWLKHTQGADGVAVVLIKRQLHQRRDGWTWVVVNVRLSAWKQHTQQTVVKNTL